ncbi:MAG: PilZ domain-containing protein [Deltaproteobacteria bacterium]|nr:PilZ domain-containing protein [Deltaproteobacteria bacterium]
MESVEERRIKERVETPGGEAICHFRGFGEHYIMDDISLRGARMRWGPLIPVGSEVKVVIFAGALGMVTVGGRVVRHGKDGISLGISFQDLDTLAEHTLEDIVIEAQLESYSPADFLENCPP